MPVHNKLAEAMTAEIDKRLDDVEKQYEIKLDTYTTKVSKQIQSKANKIIFGAATVVILFALIAFLSTYYTASAKINEASLTFQKDLVAAYKEINQARAQIDESKVQLTQQSHLLEQAVHSAQSEVDRLRMLADRYEKRHRTKLP
ncbi:MAG: hypothetical protein ABR936_09325 [Bacteroidota bacterium]|jgi:tetrahydromethanopterin S-methyltransferase subunit G